MCEDMRLLNNLIVRLGLPFIALVVVCAYTGDIASADETRTASFQQESSRIIDRQIRSGEIRAASLALVVDRQLRWTHQWRAGASGEASADTLIVFAMGSLSKVITATAVMQLSEKGAFGLDDNVTLHL